MRIPAALDTRTDGLRLGAATSDGHEIRGRVGRVVGHSGRPAVVLEPDECARHRRVMAPAASALGPVG